MAEKPVARVAVAAFFLAIAFTSPSLGSERPTALQALDEEIAIAGIHERLAGEPVPEVSILRNVRVVDPVDRTVKDGQSVIVSLGAIYWVGDAASEPDVGDATIIDGGGKFAAPGLTDMHIHTESAADWLLNVANGVTTVREMDGFPWMLAAREKANAERLLAPTMYVAGTIINYAPLGGYAVTPKDSFATRRTVRAQRACGYDFIKIHNLVPKRIFDAVADEAKRENIDLVGHVPNWNEVRYAADHGMRTMEHLKGWLNDRNLKLGDTDYAVAGRDDLWVTPAEYAVRNFADHKRMAAMASAPEARFVPARRRAEWAEIAAAPETPGFRANLEAHAIRREIMTALVKQGAHFLAGTDAATYPFQVMGFALIEEMRLLLAAGVPQDEVFRAATVNAAAAMRAETDFGRIEKGMRPDIVLLDTNPLYDVAAYAENEGVMVRGRWLSRAALDVALAELAALYADDAPRSKAKLLAIVDAAEEAVRGGFVFNARILIEAGEAFRTIGEKDAAARIEALAVNPEVGPCAAEVH